MADSRFGKTWLEISTVLLAAKGLTQSTVAWSTANTRTLRCNHDEQIQGFITQRLYDSQQRLLRSYFFPGRVEKRIRFGLGLDECVPWMPAFPFLTQTGRDWNAAMTELRLEHIIKHVDLDMSHHIGMGTASHGAQNIFFCAHKLFRLVNSPKPCSTAAADLHTISRLFPKARAADLIISTGCPALCSDSGNNAFHAK